MEAPERPAACHGQGTPAQLQRSVDFQAYVMNEVKSHPRKSERWFEGHTVPQGIQAVFFQFKVRLCLTVFLGGGCYF